MEKCGNESLLLILALLPLVIPFEANGQDNVEVHNHDAEEVEEIVVQATRSRRRLQDEPIRVEVLSQEEIEEKLLMRPGNISMMLNETGGLRVQVTSPALGSANVRVYGMRGRYTQLLADGLPLYGGQASSLGLLQVPPSDLGQVEIIKGAASALYGGQALGGVINLVSRRPTDEPSGEITLNATTKNGQDVSGYGSTRFSDAWSGSLLTGYNRNSQKDLDSDGWIDMPRYERWSARPRLFWNGQDGSSVFMTVGSMIEDRRGGTLGGRVVPDGDPFEQSQETRRLDGGLTFERPVGDHSYLQARASAVNQSHRHRFGDLVENDQHDTVLAEISVASEAVGRSWIGGVAFQADDYESDAFPVFDYSYEAPALFVQADIDLSDDVTIAGSARWDDHSEYGGRFSPRLSLLYRPGSWTVRASWGRGFYAPTPFIEETEAAGLSRLEPFSGLRAEIAQTASLDIGYATGAWETSLTYFGSNIDNAVGLETVSEDQARIVNIDGVTRTRGLEALLRWRQSPYTITASYLYLDTSEADQAGTGRREVPLTPRHSAGLVAMWERHGQGRLGLELYYTGKQSLVENPFRDEGRPYLHIGLLGEIVLGRYRLFLNLENLLDVRQTKKDPLLRPSRTPDGRWTVDAWAPLEGFIANAGVRISLGSASD